MCMCICIIELVRRKPLLHNHPIAGAEMKPLTERLRM